MKSGLNRHEEVISNFAKAEKTLKEAHQNLRNSNVGYHFLIFEYPLDMGLIGIVIKALESFDF